MKQNRHRTISNSKSSGVTSQATKTSGARDARGHRKPARVKICLGKDAFAELCALAECIGCRPRDVAWFAMAVYELDVKRQLGLAHGQQLRELSVDDRRALRDRWKEQQRQQSRRLLSELAQDRLSRALSGGVGSRN